MFENPRRGRQARDFTTNVPKILDLKSSSEQIFSRKLSLGAPVFLEMKIGVTPVQSLQFSSRSLPSCKTKQNKIETKQNEIEAKRNKMKKTKTKTKRVRLRCSETAAQSYRVL